MLASFNGHKFALKLEITQHAQWSGTFVIINRHAAQMALGWGHMQAKLYDLNEALYLKTITVKASLPHTSREVFATYRDDNLHWRFSKDGDRDTKTTKYLVWEEVTAT